MALLPPLNGEYFPPFKSHLTDQYYVYWCLRKAGLPKDVINHVFKQMSPTGYVHFYFMANVSEWQLGPWLYAFPKNNNLKGWRDQHTKFLFRNRTKEIW